MKTIKQYLEECKEAEYHNLHCYSMDYAMTIPNEEYEKEFYEAKRDLEIVEQLLDMTVHMDNNYIKKEPPTQEQEINNMTCGFTEEKIRQALKKVGIPKKIYIDLV